MAEWDRRGALQVLWALFAVCQAAAAAGPRLQVRVFDGRAGIYATTNTGLGAVAWLSPGTELTVRGDLTESSWVRVVPPEKAGVWIYRELVQDGHVRANGCRVRSGPGMTFVPIAGLNKGDRVEILGTYGDWFRIKPPPGIDFWVLRDQVEPLAEAPPEEVATDSPDGQGAANAVAALPNGGDGLSVVTKPPAVTNALAAVRPPSPPELNGYTLEDGVGQGVDVTLKGTLDWGLVGSVAAPFCLVTQTGGDAAPVCHLLAPAQLYESRVGETVTVEGSRWQVKGSEIPVIIPRAVRFEGAVEVR